MNMNDYQVLAERTDRPVNQMDGILHASMGMVGEAAETLDHVKKVLEQGHELNKDKLIEEAGDNLWYIAKLARYCGVSLDDLAQRNIDKLRRRYPDGFTVQCSVGRAE